MITCHKRFFLLLENGAKGRNVKLTPALLMEHIRRAILRDGVQQIVAYGNTGDTWIVDVTAGHLTAKKLQQLRAVATALDVQDMGRITRLVLSF
jgi:hypothetical protein